MYCLRSILTLALALSLTHTLAHADMNPPDAWAPALSDLDDLIPPARRAAIDAAREYHARALEAAVFSPDVPQLVDLRARDTAVKQQFKAWSGWKLVGTCTDFGLIAAMENKLGGQIDLSERHFWSEYHVASSASAITAASTGYGVVESSWWPSNKSKPWAGYLDQPWYKLSQYEALDSDITKVIASLAAGNPVYIAMSTPADMYNNRPVHVDPNSGPLPNSGHALAVVGYQLNAAVPGGGELLVKNSWGTNNGDKGYQWVPFNLCSKSGMYCDFWSIQAVNHD